MKTTDYIERFEEDFYADPRTAFIKHMRPATLEEQKSIQKHIEEISKPTGINFWDTFEELDEKICKHIECPYKGCSYHKYTTNKHAFLSSELPIYMPRSQEEMDRCMSYIDI